VNGGTTWEPQNILSTSASSSGVHFLDQNIGWISATEVNSGTLILSTINGGATWTTSQLGVNNALNALQFVDAQTGWGVGNGGAILKLIHNPTAVRENSPARSPNEFGLFQNYPNPFNPSTAIQYALAQPGVVQLSIHDALGRQIRTLVNTWKTAGKHVVVWDGRDDAGRVITSGVYFYRLVAGESVQQRKLTLAK
jgi:hypothetical protein